MKFNTKILHGKAGRNTPDGGTLPGISQVSAFSYDSAEHLEKVFGNKAPGFAYTRIGNPTVAAFEQRINELEGGVGAVACASGMAAITAALLNVLSAGDEIIAGSGLFGGTIDLFKDLEAFGITTHFIPHITVEDIKTVLNPNIKVVFGELIGNPGLDVVNIKEVTDFLHENGVPFIADATTATPYLVNALSLGADVVIHSSSKYINGSGNSISGIIVDGGKFKWDKDRYPAMKEYSKYGKFAYTARLRNDVWRNMGGCLAPMNAYLNILGLETLGIRMKVLCQNALTLAKALEELAGITVNYPGLESSPYKPLVDEFKAALGDSVEDVRMTLRLTDSPSCIVTDPNGLDPAFVRMMKAAGQDVPEPKPILELNPNNPLVSRLKEQGAFSPEWAKLFLEQAQLMEGEQLKDPAGFINRMNTMLMDTIGKKSVN